MAGHPTDRQRAQGRKGAAVTNLIANHYRVLALVASQKKHRWDNLTNDQKAICKLLERWPDARRIHGDYKFVFCAESEVLLVLAKVFNFQRRLERGA